MGFLTYIAVTTVGAGLTLIGFGVAGPIGGSIAASVQSAWYGGAVASGSLFSVLQSVAMTLPTP